MRQLQLYAIIGLLLFSVSAGGMTYYLWNKNVELNQELKEVKAARVRAETNLALVSVQLDNERELKAIVQDAMNQLGRVPDVDFNTPLPDSISDLLNDFNERMR